MKAGGDESGAHVRVSYWQDDAKIHSAVCLANICAAAASAQDEIARAGAVPLLVATERDPEIHG